MIEHFASQIPEELKSRSGSVFYSGGAAFGKQSDLYVLGLNPGGDPEAQEEQTIGWHTEHVLKEHTGNWSAYRDECWKNAKKGKGGMQPRVVHLLESAGFDPGLTPASNVIFERSRNESELGAKLRELARICWPFHRDVIQQLRPRVVLCFGRTAGAYVRKKLGATREYDAFVENNNRRWTSRAYEGKGCPKVIVATHPGRANWCNPDSDPTDLLVRALEK